MKRPTVSLSKAVSGSAKVACAICGRDAVIGRMEKSGGSQHYTAYATCTSCGAITTADVSFRGERI